MGNVERFGLLALFVLCALIVGVGIFGSDGTRVPRFEKAQLRNGNGNGDVQAVPRDPRAAGGWSDPLRSNGVADASLGAGGGLRPVRRQARETDRVTQAPAPHRTSSFDPTPLEPLNIGTEPAAPEEKREVAQGGGAAPKVASKTYVVQPGDSIWALAKKFYGTPTKANQRRLVDANPKYAKTLPRGATIVIPAVDEASKGPRKNVAATPKGTKRYVPKRGDSLSTIAKEHLGSAKKQYVDMLRRANPSIVDDVVIAGKPLVIPVVAAR